MNEGYEKIRDSAEQWKMASNQATTKQAQESFHPKLYFNKFGVEEVQTQKHLGHKQDKK